MSIKLEHITYTYSPGTVYEMHALKDVDIEIPDGQFMGIIGHTCLLYTSDAADD